jgi:hypothetical protein
MEENICMNEDQYRISGAFTAFVTACALILGFGIGSYFHDDSTTRITLIIVLGVLLAVIGQARSVWMEYESVYIDMLATSRQEESELLDKRLQLEKATTKQLELDAKRQGKNNKQHAQVTKAQDNQTYDFTSDDFDGSAIALLSKPIKAARKVKAKITGQGLIELILKSIR